MDMRFLILPIMAATLAACSTKENPEPVAAQDVSLRNSPILTAQPRGQTNTVAEKICYWNDKKYSDGATICDAKRRLKCWGDKWVDIGNC